MTEQTTETPPVPDVSEGQAMSETPSYHDLFITTPTIPRTSIFDLPYNVEVMCNRVGGWSVWDSSRGDPKKWRRLGGEYDDEWLILDVAGHVIVNSRDREASRG